MNVNMATPCVNNKQRQVKLICAKISIILFLTFIQFMLYQCTLVCWFIYTIYMTNRWRMLDISVDKKLSINVCPEHKYGDGVFDYKWKNTSVSQWLKWELFGPNNFSKFTYKQFTIWDSFSNTIFVVKM